MTMNDFLKQNGITIVLVLVGALGSFFAIKNQADINRRDIDLMQEQIVALEKDGNRITVLEANYGFVVNGLNDIKDDLKSIKDYLNVR